MTQERMATAIATLRRFARRPPDRTPCELCAVPLEDPHGHLLDVDEGKLMCTCTPCTLRFASDGRTRYKRVDTRRERLQNVSVDEETWQALGVPIELAFFVRDSRREAIVARFPSPAGVVEATVPESAWARLTAAEPRARELEPDVEALLVRRDAGAAHAYRISIDECYRLTGLLRRHWRGMQGGEQVWAEVDRFFEEGER